MRIFKRLSATLVLLVALSLTAAAGEVGTGPLAPEPTPTASSPDQSANSTSDAGDGEVGTGPSAVVVLIEFLLSALP